MSKLIYLDNAATTKTAPEVVEAMLPYFTEYYGNPSSVYSFAAQNKEVITQQREIIANALGAAVSRNEQQELGWATVRKIQHVPTECFELPEQFNVMQWHSETFEIPKGAVHLAENTVCRNQMYQIGKNVLGFQFHPEIVPETLALFLENDEELNKFSGQYVATETELKKSPKLNFIEGNQILNSAIDYVLRQTVY